MNLSIHKGFTLIELMIVVAILGILAAVATAQYQTYTGRTQLAEAMEISAALKADIGEALQNSTALANINSGAQNIPPAIAANAGQYVNSITVSAGVITATMKPAGVSPCVAGQTLSLTPVLPANINDPISWTCTSTASCKPITCN